jgi:hypothetical protein
MSRFAALLMFLAWLLYGAMPATAMPMGSGPMAGMDMSPAPHAPHVMAEDGTAAHAMTSPTRPSHAMGDMAHDHGASAEVPKAKMTTAKAMASADAAHCPHGGKICVAPFCAACLTLLPEMTFIDGRPLAYRYPAPGPAPHLVSADPLPATPPPRA